MADDTNTQAGGAQQNPLDILEKLLDEIDDGKSGKKPNAKSLLNDTPVAPKGPTPEEIAAKEAEEELEKKRLEYEQKKAEQQIIDQRMIEEQQKALAEEMKTGTANIAREQKNKEKKEKEEENHQSEDGYEVVQLDHTKI